MDWSPQQEAIFDWFAAGDNGHLAVTARAGTGKTTTIIEAIRRAPEQRVLLCAFNKEIQVELERRLARPGAEAKTLNALGHRFVREQIGGQLTLDTVARAKQLVGAVLSASERRQLSWEQQKTIGDICYKVREVEPHTDTIDAVVDIAQRFDLLTGDDDDLDGTLCARALDAVRYACSPEGRSGGVIDFADQIFLPLRLGWVRACYDLVVVDEAQDMSAAQLELAMGACAVSGRVVVVGDDRQAIYGFRGAAPDALARTRDTLEAAELKLTVTYRCPRSVVQLAQQIVPDFTAAPSAPEGVVRDAEADEIYDARPGDFVVSRTNAPLAKLCLGLLSRGVRAQIRGRDVGAGIRRLIKQSRARDVASLLSWLEGWAQREQAKIARAVKDGAISERLGADRSEILHDQGELIRLLCAEVDTLAEVERRAEQLFGESDAGGVVLSTTHKIKGLEADRVWMLVDTYAPHPKHGESTEGQNLRYVAITRARRELVRVPEIGRRFRREAD